MKKNNTILTFVENNDRTNPKLSPDAEIFSIPYARILQAANFCKAEEMDYCFVGYRDFMWVIQATEAHILPSVKVTVHGLDVSEKEKYLISTSELNSRFIQG